MYHDIIQLAREVMIDLGLTDREIPLEERPRISPLEGEGTEEARAIRINPQAQSVPSR